NQDSLLCPKDLILDTHVSSNPPPPPTHTRSRKSPNPKKVVLISEASSSQDPNSEGDDGV
ncbi:hypothetical protein HAX54_014576, partial [Datura stramonium]|nr:hypothetical protein [Datura stramonium]